MTVAILALQGAFIEHQKKIESLGHNCIELRCKEDLNKPFDRLILPGGESTAQGKLLRVLEMFTPIQHMIENGMPVLGTCAGLILLAETIDGESPYLGTLPVTVKRNAYGRQLGSFYTEGVFGDWEDVPMTFIRAPYIASASKDCTVLATIEGNIVGVRYQNQIGISFHPELNEDTRIHELFLSL